MFYIRGAPQIVCLTATTLVITFISLNWQSSASAEESPSSIPGNTIAIIKSFGFIAEEHKVVTKDGYILIAIRVVNPLADPHIVAKLYNPVLLNHGILFSSSNYVLQGNNSRPRLPTTKEWRPSLVELAAKGTNNIRLGDYFHNENDDKDVDEEKKLPEKTLNEVEQGDNETGASSLPFILSNNLFDVWLLNGRGLNYYQHGLSDQPSQQSIDDRMQRRKSFFSDKQGNNYHVNKSISYSDYWNFSLDQQIQYDVPAFIEKIQQVTNWSKVSYIAHSQGTTLMFALLSSQPQYSNNINAFIALAPVAYTRHMKGVFGAMLPYLYRLLHKVNGSFLPFNINQPIAYTLGQICKNVPLNPIMPICRYVFDLVNGLDNKETLLTGFVFAHLFQSTSLKSLAHFGQIYLTDRFERFREESKDLTQLDGQYDLAQINLTSMIFFRSPNDYLSGALDQDHLLASLKVPLYEDHIIADYNHDDFLWAKDRTDKINQPIIDTLKRLATAFNE